MAIETDLIWNEFHKGLRAFVARRVGSPADVDDILQEVFLRIHQKIAGVKRPARLTSWIFQITRNAMIDHYRAAGKRSKIPSGLSAEIPTEEKGRELSACLRPMIERLPSRYRDAVVLVELEGMTGSAAAKRLGLSASGIKSRVQRGRKKLKGMLEACCRIQLDPRRGVADYDPRDPYCRSCNP